MTSSVRIRVAEPNPQDLAAYRRLLPLTHRDRRGIDVDGLEALFFRSDSLHSASATHLACTDLGVVGFVCCFPGSEYSARERASGGEDRSLRRAVGSALRQLRGARLGPLDPASFHLQAIAVDPDTRHRGVGTRLFTHAASLGARSGASLLSVDTDSRNTTARSFFERRGCRRVRTRGHLTKLQLEIRA